ncbi:hypothetical protein [uncultured Spirosoma sp.]|uniref:hypothetical protein n=1 Tax=uncultured Spirosoma sp. TaxID=278208 RepID=UPI0025900502|nr:hypothetical protein [uncultured Spirosoma sp.]
MLIYAALIFNLLLPLNKDNCLSLYDAPLCERYSQFDSDFLDVYNLKIANAFLYGKCDEFLASTGLPDKIMIGQRTFNVHSKTDIDRVLSVVKEPEIAVIHYAGIDMWYVYDNEIIPSTIDFRKANKHVTYGETIFDNTYTFKEFKKQFPKSASINSKTGQSFFSMATQEKGNDFEHYLLLRKSKDDSNVTLMVEFTFEKGNLIYIFFANF